MIINNTVSVAIDGNQVHFKYTHGDGRVRSANLVIVEKGILEVSFNDNRVVIIYTFTMVKSMLFSFLLLAILDFIFFFG